MSEWCSTVDGRDAQLTAYLKKVALATDLGLVFSSQFLMPSIMFSISPLYALLFSCLLNKIKEMKALYIECYRRKMSYCDLSSYFAMGCFLLCL